MSTSRIEGLSIIGRCQTCGQSFEKANIEDFHGASCPGFPPEDEDDGEEPVDMIA